MASNTAFDRGRGISVGSVFGRSFDVIRSNPVATLGTSFLVMALPQLLFGLIGTGTTFANTPRLGLYVTAGLGGLVIGVLWLVASGALVHATIAHDRGRKADLAEVLRVGATRALPLFAVYLLFTIGVSIGTLLLFVPGVMLAVMWSVALPAIVAERTGVYGAFGRSRALTKGARWPVFGIMLLAVVIYTLASATVGVASIAGNGTYAAIASGARVAAPRLPLLAQLLQAAVSTVVLTWFTTVGTSLFVELRHWKDGPDADRLADIFA
ncbi:hypothetical protein FHT00_000747 [Sphingomonas insulae]|nr:glycerophosphoryl diester phosphodiesterase membrane domain-containing protein [Sphingomonas insulae]NIJ28819.1 hypothetical protein [Sphingomonas insulae]